MESIGFVENSLFLGSLYAGVAILSCRLATDAKIARQISVRVLIRVQLNVRAKNARRARTTPRFCWAFNPSSPGHWIQYHNFQTSFTLNCIVTTLNLMATYLPSCKNSRLCWSNLVVSPGTEVTLVPLETILSRCYSVKPQNGHLDCQGSPLVREVKAHDQSLCSPLNDDFGIATHNTLTPLPETYDRAAQVRLTYVYWSWCRTADCTFGGRHASTRAIFVLPDTRLERSVLDPRTESK
jgi:hypothetical protein